VDRHFSQLEESSLVEFAQAFLLLDCLKPERKIFDDVMTDLGLIGV
jgi:hypothetical protein